MNRGFRHHGKHHQRSTPIPVQPPRIPTPMPPISNNNNSAKCTSAITNNGKDSNLKTQLPPSVGCDIPNSASVVATAAVVGNKLISKTSYKLLDNDVKTAWINPRLISKVDMEVIRSTEYVLPMERNMNYHNYHRSSTSNAVVQNYYQKSSCGRNHDREWEAAASPLPSSAIAAAGVVPSSTSSSCTNAAASVNGRAATVKQQQQHRLAALSPYQIPQQAHQQPVPAPIQTTADVKRKQQRSVTVPKSKPMDLYRNNASKSKNKTCNNNNTNRAVNAINLGGRVERKSQVFASATNNHPQYHQQQHQQLVQQQPKQYLELPRAFDRICCGESGSGSVYGVYAETKCIYAVAGFPIGHAAQASAAAAFFARAAQKLNLSTSPYRRKRYNSDDAESSGFCGVLQRTPPPVPPALLRRIGVKEVTGVGKVKVMLRVSSSSSGTNGTDNGSNNSFFSLDKRKKQVTLIDPSTCNGSGMASSAPEDRRVGVAAPKMFAFDAIFSQDDSQTEICSSALTDVIHAVINGTDGCLFCFGHAGLGKSYTMLGTPESANTLGIIPCAISWLFKGINEQKQKTGARFSVRVSAVEVCGPTNQLRDLLAGYSNDSEQSPGMYLRDDPLFTNQPSQCELRVPTAEKAAHYLDAAIEGRAPTKEDTRDSHLLFTLHVYQYSVAGKGGVAGGRSRLHLIDLGNSERGKASGGIPLSGLGNILLAIFNGQKHLPYKEHKLTQLLKECLSSLTCHAAMIVHVSPFAQNYCDTLTTVQLASRIHRMRRRRIKFVSAAVGNGSGGGSSGEEAANRTTATSSEPDPSSSDLSADTVIYVGPADDATDGEHPPVYIPSLNSGDNRCSMSKALRGSSAEKPSKQTKNDEKPSPSHRIKCQSNKTSPAHSSNSPKPSPSRIPSIKNKADLKHVALPGVTANLSSIGAVGGCTAVSVGGAAVGANASDEQWIDGPRISKSKVAEARHLMKEPCHVKKRETWIDGPMQETATTTATFGYGYMDSHKKNMIRKWVEHQTSQIQKSKHHTGRSNETKHHLKELTQFKICDDESTLCQPPQPIIKPLDTSKKSEIEESTIRTGLKISSVKTDTIPEKVNDKKVDEDVEDEEETVEIPPALPLIQPLSSREVSLESLDMLLKERMLSNAEYNSYQNHVDESVPSDQEEEDEILEIIEVEEPLEPVPMQDCCLQVTEEDIAFCMGLENPLPEVDQENPLDHPLRILSQENLTVVSTFTDSMSVYTDLERILPRYKYDRCDYNDDYEDPDFLLKNGNHFDETTQKKFEQLAKLHELYSNRLAKANVANSETYQQQKRTLTRCESLTLTDMLYGAGGGCGVVNDNSSIYSEPAYTMEKFCENCKVMMRPSTAQNYYFFSTSTQELFEKSNDEPPQLSGRFQRYSHKYNIKDNLAYLRHPDGASNPNLREESHIVSACSQPVNKLDLDKSTTQQSSNITSTTPPNSLPSVERLNRAILSLDTSVAAIKLTHKSEGYDSGHDSTPRTSKHSPAAISRRAESGYDSVVRDSESSSIDSEPSRVSTHLPNRRAGSKCKHKHEKSFCSWFLNPFTCKYIDEPPETHF